MTIDLTTLDPYEQPSDELRAAWKAYKLTDHVKFANHPDIDELDVSNLGDFHLSGHTSGKKLKESFRILQGDDERVPEVPNDVPIYFHPLLPGTPLSISWHTNLVSRKEMLTSVTIRFINYTFFDTS